MSTGALSPEFLGRQIGQLTEIQYITSGGQKYVYRATHGVYGATALKVFRETADRTRFDREIQAVQGIGSVHVPTIHEFGTLEAEHGGYLWLLEQWVPGESLRARLNRGPLPAPNVLKLGVTLLEVLAAAEERGIVHRDVKPENILVDDAGNSNCWLTDFGIARHLQQSTLTHGAWGLFTCGYAPPEQFRNVKDQIDGRSDLFALGVTLFECVQGVNPFTQGARSRDEILGRVENQALPRVGGAFSGTHPFADLIESMTRTRRTHRLGTVREAYEWMLEIATTCDPSCS